MSPGRKRRSAADAVARPLALVLAVVVSALPRAVHSQDSVPPPLPPPRVKTITCDYIPQPFGPSGASSPGFEVTCGSSMEAMLTIGDHKYVIDSVSVPEAHVAIFAPPITQVCYDSKGKPGPDTGTGPMSLEATPFTFSKSNKLVNFGCNHMLNITSVKQAGDPSSIPVHNASCTTTTTINGSCPGEACCVIPIPDQVNGAKEFNLSFERLTAANTTAKEDGTCSSVFLLDESIKQVFTFGAKPRMTLDWVIGSTTCEQAASYTLEPLCNINNGTCVDAPSGAGYLCECQNGYGGNPYVTNGCEDIDECQHDSTNNCTHHDLCNNTLGGYTCRCPENYHGDGYRTGQGCTATPSISVCNHTENNPCTISKYCTIDALGGASCSCPEGMSGDGWKKGSGCRKLFPRDTVLGVGLALVVTMTTAVSCYCWAIKKRELGRKRAELFRKNGGLLLQQRFSTITSHGKDQPAKIFSAEELKTATDNYSENRILGRGGHGTVYKGILPDRTIVAIKKSKLFDESQVEQFINEITILSQIDHPNVVKLLGCCLETLVPLLVYEFIPNGTLFQHIHNRNSPRPLTWEEGLRIAAETAEALTYLHSTSSTPIIHRDIKSSNILLDENFVAKVADFGASRSVPFDRTHITTLIQGTIGYLDPEYFQSSQLTEKSDVYSFGVVLAELLTRRKPISAARPEESCNLAMHLVVLFSEGRLLQEIEPRILAEAGEEQFYALAELSVRCLNLKGEERPTMEEVTSVLNALRRSFTIEQTIGRDEMVRENSEQEEKHLRESRPISSFQSSEVSTQCSMEAAISTLSHGGRDKSGRNPSEGV